MDFTQIAFGLGLLAIGSLSFVSPSSLDTAVLSLLTGIGLVAGIGLLFSTLARDARGS
ncbi:hypothetical protein [Salinadaptatus halalkaliphilus]|uniref:hypothetical protein n=1 Tax=Salinadaptatus halalkaliphilus TaxID=2419781 RepID=UPI00158078C3|nr:hypothetical protein [Salinadaptatus halalkaliphilus]